MHLYPLAEAEISDAPPSDDKVEQFHLSDAFDATCRAWEVRADNLLSPTLIDTYSHDRNDTVCHMPSAGVLPQGIPSVRDLRGLSPTPVQDTIHTQDLHHPLISLRSSQRRIHRTTTLLLSSVYQATLPPKHNAKARPYGAESARLLACGKGR